MVNRPKVFVTRMIPQIGLDPIARVCDMEVWSEPLPPSAEILRDKIRVCEGVVTLLTDSIDAALMDSAPNLRVISNYAVGYNNIDIPAATQRGIAVGNTPGVLTESTADLAVLLLLAAARRLIEGCDDARSGRWLTWEPRGYLGQDLVGRTLGIVGMGRIGQAVACRCHFGWGMRVIYSSNSPKPEVDTLLKATQVEFHSLLEQSDFVSVHCSLNDRTRGLFGRESFARMKPGSIFINTARGSIVDQSALEVALRDGPLFSAGLDVTDPEPLPPTHPLFRLPNLVIAPHIASATFDTRNAMARICADNLIAGIKGLPLPACVNPHVHRRR